MKAIFTAITGILVWVLVGHFLPSLSIFLTAFYLPALFAFAPIFANKSANNYVYTAVCFALVLLSDYLFRIYGGGEHDDAGRGICELVFYASLGTSTITLAVLKVIDSVRKNNSANRLNITKMIIDVSLVFVLSVATLLFFRRYNVHV